MNNGSLYYHLLCFSLPHSVTVSRDITIMSLVFDSQRILSSMKWGLVGIALWWEASKKTHTDSYLLAFIPLCSPLPLSVGCTQRLTFNDANMKSEGMALLRKVNYRMTLVGVPCCGEVPKEGTWARSSVNSQQGTEAYNDLCEWAWNQPFWPSSEAFTWGHTQADILTMTLWETMSQRYPAELLPDSWPIRTKWC